MVKDAPFLVGIAGGSGSGKTFLARSVANVVGTDQVAILSMDQYFRTPKEDVERADVNFDHPAHLDFRLMISHLRTLRLGRTVLTPAYDFGLMVGHPRQIRVEAKPVILVEGLFVLAKPMVELFDLTCFLDVAADQRLLGRVLRDVRERGASLEEIVDRYQRFVRPSYDVFVSPTKQNADVVVDFSYRRLLFERLIANLIRARLEGAIDTVEFVNAMRAECHHLGFIPRKGEMPVAVDIFKLAKTYPESVSATPVFTITSSSRSQ